MVRYFTEADLQYGDWMTADGNRIPYHMVTQSHWSNIYWYHKFMTESVSKNKEEKFKCFSTGQFALAQLKLRFKGELLDWIPKYEYEKVWWNLEQNTRKILIEKCNTKSFNFV